MKKDEFKILNAKVCGCGCLDDAVKHASNAIVKKIRDGNCAIFQLTALQLEVQMFCNMIAKSMAEDGIPRVIVESTIASMAMTAQEGAELGMKKCPDRMREELLRIETLMKKKDGDAEEVVAASIH